MKEKKKEPERTCLGCRKKITKNQLIRIVKTPENKFVIDSTGKINGRGAYICKNEECVKKCIKTKALNRNFKTTIENDVYDKLLKEFECLKTIK